MIPSTFVGLKYIQQASHNASIRYRHDPRFARRGVDQGILQELQSYGGDEATPNTKLIQRTIHN